MALKKFNIRVYGLLIENQKALVVDEIVKGWKINKFPGGGLELGEGPKDCLIREFKEESGLEVSILSHFYTTDFFQPSAFNPEDQIISIYFLVKNNSEGPTGEIDPPFHTHSNTENIQGFRWLPITDRLLSEISLPIDKRVVELLLELKDSRA